MEYFFLADVLAENALHRALLEGGFCHTDFGFGLGPLDIKGFQKDFPGEVEGSPERVRAASSRLRRQDEQPACRHGKPQTGTGNRGL